MALSPSLARAESAIRSFGAAPSSTQAGGHPDFDFHFTLSSHDSEFSPCDCNDARDATAHLPAGLIGNPAATPKCNIAQFASDRCPVDSQLGIVLVGVAKLPGNEAGSDDVQFFAPVFNLTPPPGQPGLLGFKAALTDSPTFEDVGARTAGDYGLDVAVTSIEHFVPLVAFEQVTWGVPASPLHDSLRFGFAQPLHISLSNSAAVQAEFCNENGEPSHQDPAMIYEVCGNGALPPHPVGAAEGGPGGPVSSNSPETPFLQNPTTCGAASLPISLDVLAYDGGKTHAESQWPPTADCSQLSFNPSQSIEPTTQAADSPSGAEVRLTVPQFESPSVPSPSELRAARVTFPQGFSLAPNVTNGKITCSEAQAKMGAYASTEEGHCPEDSKIGTISVDTPVLPGPLHGAAYLGEPKPGNRFRIFLVFDGFGVHVKLPGTATPDPLSGQLHISFENLPQAPFESFNMHVFGAERGPLDTPNQCGTYEVVSEWTPWDAALSNQASRQFFHVTEGPSGTPCPNGPRPFHPSLQAAATASAGGHHTDFWLNLLREDGEQNLSALAVTTPPGFAATLKGLTYCPDSALAAAALESHFGFEEQAQPSCPPSSYVGELIAGAGPGSHPLYLAGKAYLAGPYRGAPLSLAFITPAVSAGYDLGSVVIRAAIRVNPETAQVSTVSDPLPQIFGGIPLRLRQVFVDLNRPGFALNPTNCEPSAVTAQIGGDEGASASGSASFQVSNCAALPFKPTLSIAFTGSTKHAGSPGVRALLRFPKGGGPYANVASTSVTLPPTELIDNAHISDPCTRALFNQGANPGERCPAGSVLGFARAETPLLDHPLEGPVYLRSAQNRNGLPDIVAALNGQIDITLDGKIATVGGNRLRTTFAAIPDAPVSRFALTLAAGRRSLLETSAGSLCAQPLHFSAEIDAQNGMSADRSPLLRTPCRKGQGRHRGARISTARRAVRGGGGR